MEKQVERRISGMDLWLRQRARAEKSISAAMTRAMLSAYLTPASCWRTFPIKFGMRWELLSASTFWIRTARNTSRSTCHRIPSASPARVSTTTAAAVPRQILTGPALEAFLMRKRGATWDNLPLTAFSLGRCGHDETVAHFKQVGRQKGDALTKACWMSQKMC